MGFKHRQPLLISTTLALPASLLGRAQSDRNQGQGQDKMGLSPGALPWFLPGAAAQQAPGPSLVPLMLAVWLSHLLSHTGSCAFSRVRCVPGHRVPKHKVYLSIGRVPARRPLPLNEPECSAFFLY